MSSVDDFLTPLLLKCEALRQNAALSCYHDLATIDNPRAGLQVFMRHSQALGEDVGALFRAEAHKILSLSHGNKLEAQKACGLLLLILTCGLEGRMTQDEKSIHFTSGHDLNPERLLKAEPDSKVKRQLLDRWKRAVSAMLYRQMALLDLELNQPEEGHPSEPTKPARGDTAPKNSLSPLEVRSVSTQDPKRGPLILLIQAARDFDLPKGSLSRATKRPPGHALYLESIREGRNVWFYKNDIFNFARRRNLAQRKNPFSQ